MTNLLPQKWEKIFFQLCKWDNDLQALADQGMMDTHVGQKKEVAKRFIQYVEENYVSWFGKKGGNPNLLTQALKRKVMPLLKKGEKTCLVVMAGFRVDQWLALQPLLEPWFKVENAISWALLPSEKTNCRAGLFSGQSPREVSLKQPQMWKKMQEEEDKAPYERELLRHNLRIPRSSICASRRTARSWPRNFPGTPKSRSSPSWSSSSICSISCARKAWCSRKSPRTSAASANWPAPGSSRPSFSKS
jgi:hypothetical protein